MYTQPVSSTQKSSYVSDIIAPCSQIVRNISRVALPVLVLAAAYSLPVAESAFADCMHDCAVVNKGNVVICGIVCALFG